MRAQVLDQIRGVFPTVVPPKNARVKETLPDGRTVYVEKLLGYWNDQGTFVRGPRKRPKLDDKGEPVWRRHHVTGEPIKQVMEKVPEYTEVEFTLEAHGNAEVRRNFYFRESEEELARRRKVKQAQELSEELADAMVERGIGVDDLLDRLGVGEGKRRPKEPADPFEGFTLKQDASGAWLMPNGEKFEGTEEDAEAALAELRELETV